MAYQGEVVWRDEAGYEEARTGPMFNGRHPDRFPAGVARPADEYEVVEAVALARERGLGITVRGGGHSVSAWPLSDDVLLIDMARMRDIDFDTDTGVVSVSPSVTGGDELAPYLAERGRVFPGGHCPSVGIGGFLLLGGQGWDCRRRGWACESIVAIDVVTADGELLRSTETERPELLWAARGAGHGFFGVITRFHLQTYPAPGAMHQSTFIWPVAMFGEVMAWAHEVLPALDPLVEPAIVATYGPHQFGSWDGVSAEEPLLVAHATAMADTPEEAQELFAPLIGCPLRDRALVDVPLAPTTLVAEYAIQEAAAPRGHRYLGDCMWTDARATELSSVLKPAFAELPTKESFAMWYGWAPRRDELPDMAFSLEGNVYCSVTAVWTDPEQDVAMENWIGEQLARWQPLSKGVYLGDANLSRRPDKFMADENLARLEEIRRRYDPEGMFASHGRSGS